MAVNYREAYRLHASLLRPSEVLEVAGDNSKAAHKLGWQPRLTFEALIEFLVEAGIKRVRGEERSIRYTPETFDSGASRP